MRVAVQMTSITAAVTIQLIWYNSMCLYCQWKSPLHSYPSINYD